MKTFTSKRKITGHRKRPLSLDVVCSMEIDPSATHYHVQYHGTVYHFCSANCRQHFENNPTQYV